MVKGLKKIWAPRVDLGLGQGVTGPVAISVENGRITAVDLRPGGVPEGDDVWSFADATILPGFINVHTHLGLDGGPDPLHTLGGASSTRRYQVMMDSARMCLDTGVTTVRDCGAPEFMDLALREAIVAGRETGPAVLASGSVITCRQGHLSFMGWEADTAAEVRGAVAHLHARGVDFVKVVLSGGRIDQHGRYTRFQSQYSVDVLRALVEEAHRAGLKVAAHAHPVDAISVAIEAQVDSIEHCLWLTPGGQRFVRESARRMAERGIWVVPTVSRSFPRPERRLPNDNLIPDADRHLDILRTMAAEGVRLVAGGDNGAAFNPQSEFPREVHLLADVLGSHTLAIRAATSWAATCLGIDHETGSIQVGKRADLVVIPGNSDETLVGVWSPLATVKQGQAVPRQTPAPSTSVERPR